MPMGGSPSGRRSDKADSGVMLMSAPTVNPSIVEALRRQVEDKARDAYQLESAI
jgi:hypothetical protein